MIYKAFNPSKIKNMRAYFRKNRYLVCFFAFIFFSGSIYAQYIPFAFFKTNPPQTCPSSGYLENSSCWYIGNTSESCNTVCSNLSLSYDIATRNYAGSSGSNANCDSIMVGLGIGGSSTTTIFSNRGCQFRPSNNTRRRGTNTTSSSSSSSSYRRVCACFQPDVTPNAINFVDFNDTSSSQTITGINQAINLQISAVNGTGSPALYYNHNSTGWTSFTTAAAANISVNNGETLQLRVVGTIGHTATFTVTNTSDGSTVLDTALGTVSIPPDVTPDAINWANFNDKSSTETITGITTPINLQISAVNGIGTPVLEYSYNGGAFTAFTTGSPATINGVFEGDTLQLKIKIGALNDTATFTITNLSDSSTTLDTATGTVTTLCTGYEYGGYCYYIGALGESCYDVCNGLSQGCNATGTAAGVSYSDCNSIIQGLGFSPGGGSSGSGTTYACAMNSAGSTFYFGNTNQTTCLASDGSRRRACACDISSPTSTPAFYDVDGYRYRSGNAGESCDTACSSHGGCVAAGLTHANNSNKCTEILSVLDFSWSSHGSSSGSLGCSMSSTYYVHTSATCSASQAGLTRICSCTN